MDIGQYQYDIAAEYEPEQTGAFCLCIQFRHRFLSMSISGFDALPDDDMIGVWVGDNDEPVHEKREAVALIGSTREYLQALIDGPMIRHRP